MSFVCPSLHVHASEGMCMQGWVCLPGFLKCVLVSAWFSEMCGSVCGVCVWFCVCVSVCLCLPGFLKCVVLCVVCVCGFVCV